MIIGFDVDNVLVNQAEYQLRYGVPYFKEKGMELVDPKGFDIEDMFACTHAERESFWKKYIWKYCLSEPMAMHATQVAKELRSEGHRIFIITGRAHTTEPGVTGAVFRWMLKHWLKKNRFIYDEIFFCSESKSSDDKTRICLEQKVDVLIDDKPENLLALKDKINVICYPAPWNEDVSELDEYRVTDMNGVLERIRELKL